MRVPDRPQIENQLTDKPHPGDERGEVRAVTDRHSPGWYRELRQRLDRLPEAHPSSWQAPDRTDAGAAEHDRARPGGWGEESDIWWRPARAADAAAVNPGGSSRFGGRGPAEVGTAERWLTDSAPAGGAVAGGAVADGAPAEGGTADGESGPEPGEPDTAGPGRRGDSPDGRDVARPDRPAGSSGDGGRWGELGGPFAEQGPYRPWFSAGAAASPWFAARD